MLGLRFRSSADFSPSEFGLNVLNVVPCDDEDGVAGGAEPRFLIVKVYGISPLNKCSFFTSGRSSLTTEIEVGCIRGFSSEGCFPRLKTDNSWASLSTDSKGSNKLSNEISAVAFKGFTETDGGVGLRYNIFTFVYEKNKSDLIFRSLRRAGF